MENQTYALKVALILLVSFIYGCGKSEYRSPPSPALEPLAQTGQQPINGINDPLTNPNTQPPLVPPQTQPGIIILPNIPPPTDPIIVVERNFRDITVSAVGDSISAGFNASGLFLPDYSRSWATGPNVDSHYTKIADLVFGTDIGVQSYNYSRLGGSILKDDSQSLENQVLNLSDDLDPQDYNYVTIMIGGNDVCQADLPDAELKAKVKARLADAIDLLGPKSDVILLSSIPDLNEVLTGNYCPMLIPSLREYALNYLCPNRENLTEQQVIDAVEIINEAAEEVAAESAYEVVFDDYAVHDSPVQEDQVSDLDCFHPTAWGQSDISNTLWPFVEPYFDELIPVF